MVHIYFYSQFVASLESFLSPTNKPNIKPSTHSYEKLNQQKLQLLHNCSISVVCNNELEPEIPRIPVEHDWQARMR